VDFLYVLHNLLCGFAAGFRLVENLLRTLLYRVLSNESAAKCVKHYVQKRNVSSSFRRDWLTSRLGIVTSGLATGGISVYIPPNQSSLIFYVVVLSPCND